MGAPKAWWPFGDRGEEFKARIEERTETIVDKTVDTVAAEVPELVGPDPRLKELLTESIRANLGNFAAVVAYRVPSQAQFVPPAAIEHARLLAQRGISANSLLLGHQVIERSLTGPVIDAAGAFVEDRDELMRTIEAVLGALFTQSNAASHAAMRTHAEARDAWLRGRGAGLSKRLDAVLDRVVTDVRTAERTLNYVVSGKHIAFIAWLDDPERPLDMSEAERRVAAMRGVRGALLVPRDERTLYGWLHVSSSEHMDEWMGGLRDLPLARFAFGELGEGLEGFRLSHMQARSAGAVVATSRKREDPIIVRFRDVAVLSFLVDRPTESRGWAESVLGDLAESREGLGQLRQTLLVFLEEGENAIATGERLYIHRNTVRYRVDHARSLLPEALAGRRLEVNLALKYLDLVGSWPPTD